MKNPRRWLGILWVITLTLGLAQPLVAADEGEVSAPRGELMMHKLGRGAANIITCPLELLRMPTIVGREEGWIAGSTSGVVMGAWRAIKRGLAGVFDVATFYAEIPKGYAPIMQPEFVFAHGDWGK